MKKNIVKHEFIDSFIVMFLEGKQEFEIKLSCLLENC